MNIYSDRNIQYLEALLKHGSFTKAAKALYVSQPYLTQFIQRLEKELGDQIIHRFPYQIQLTEIGKLYYQYLESIEDQTNQFQHALNTLHKEDQPTIRLGILPSLAHYILPLVLPSFKEDFPDVQFELIEALPSQSEEEAIDQRIDFYIGQNPETISNQLSYSECGRQQYYAIIPESSGLAFRISLHIPEDHYDLQELLSQELVLTPTGSPIRRQVDRLINHYKIQANLILECSNIYTAAHLASRDFGLTIVPDSILDSLNSPGNHCIMPIGPDKLLLKCFIAYSKEKTLSPIEAEFYQHFIHRLTRDSDPSLFDKEEVE